VAVGSAVGAAVGAVAGVLGAGGGSAPDVAGFQERALPATTLAPGQSVEGYVYYPEDRYAMLELVFAPDGGGEALRERVPIEPDP
jgi:hypothetical protein